MIDVFDANSFNFINFFLIQVTRKNIHGKIKQCHISKSLKIQIFW